MATFPRRTVTIAFWAALPALVLALGLLWFGPYGARAQWTGTLFIAVVLVVGLSVLYDHVIRPIQTASNLLAAMREGDFSLRARSTGPDDDLGLLYMEANGLAEMLRGHRLDALESGTLLRAVMAEIDAAVLAFDADERLVLVNPRWGGAPRRPRGTAHRQAGAGAPRRRLPRGRHAPRARAARRHPLGAPAHAPSGRMAVPTSSCSSPT